MTDLDQNNTSAQARLVLDIAGMPRGIDNYHIDVRLSNSFRVALKRLVDELVRLETTKNPNFPDQSKLFGPIRSTYLDMMTMLIHRVKTGLSPLAVDCLQFAVLKHILQTSKTSLDEFIQRLRNRSAELSDFGSVELLGTHSQIAWLGKYYNSILSAVNQHILDQLYRLELRQLASIRGQYLTEDALDFPAFLNNPLLWTRDLNAPTFLILHYVYWGSLRSSSEENAFNTLNQALETLLSEQMPEQPLLPLKARQHDFSLTTEIHDELGGLLASQAFLGSALDSRSLLQESFGWLDNPDNPKLFFDLDTYRQNASELRREQGYAAWWRYRPRIKYVEAILKKVVVILKKHNLLRTLLAAMQTRKLWGQKISSQVDARQLCQYLSGQLSLKKLQDTALAGKAFNDEELKTLEQAMKEINKDLRTRPLELAASLLVEIARFRRHLKYYRFSHRLFNRVQVLSKAEDILLSRQAGTLFEMPTAAEVEEERDKIVHHTILKADVRNSTVLTEQLEKAGLNPASHFSLRFFDPINSLLSKYGAGKVFIEGDAVILSFLEYQHNLHQWFSVSRACGLARAMLAIVQANNRHSRKAGLPLLELGIGISYSNGAPRFLYDGDHQIMISSAIGLADRLSSCSWKIRELITKHSFNVEVLEIAEGERERGEKGQTHLRYNVHGILLDNQAFEKLRTEVALRRQEHEIDGNNLVFYSGEFPDMHDRKKRLLIREGRVGVWQNGQIIPGGEKAATFYEVISNNKLITLLQGLP